MKQGFWQRRVAAFGMCLAVALLPGLAGAQDWIYTVVEGDNLWNLSEQHLDRVTRFEQLRRLNGIKDPNRMRPGTRLRVPLKWIRSNPVPAEIAALQGTAELQRAAGGVELSPSPGSLIQLGDRLKTGADSSVAIRFADSTILTLYGDSLVRFDHLSAHGSTGMVDSRLRLMEGRMDTRVKPAAGPGSRFEIQTPSAISAVRGTEYRAAVTPGGQASNIEVLHGKVAVSGANRQALVKAGFGTQVVEGKPPIPPRKLLEPPQLKPIPEPIRQLNWPVTWEPLEGALQYRVEVASSPAFDTLLWQQFSKYNRAALPDLPDGAYFLRVRGADDLGLEGKNVVQRILIDARPQPPVPLKPADGHVLRGATPELQWTASAEAARYRLEIAADAEFKQSLVDRDDIDDTRFDTAALADPAKYFWRLTSIAPDGEHGPVGAERAYEVKPIPDKVAPELVPADDGKLVASWRAGAPGQTYQVQMAYDDKFTDLEFDQTSAEPKLAFEPVSGQVRYLRVRAIEPDGYEGPWGAAQRVDPIPDNSRWAILILGVLGILAL